MSLKIYLADLTHMGVGVATEAFPLNIGLIGSYAKKRFGKDVYISLFKYPDDLREALDSSVPDILGCSNYTWNTNLAYHYIRRAKAQNPEMLTVFGGTNYPFEAEPQRKFLAQRPDLDLHTHYEGEGAFSNIIERRLSCAKPSEMFDSAIAGSQFIRKAGGEFVNGPSVPRIKILDDIPSPYTTGLLDKFFDGKLTPLLETARGCPFSCNFCNAGDVYFNKVNLFSDDYVHEEFSYVAKRASEVGTGHMTLADNNFGMIPRDAKTAELVHKLMRDYGWPKTLTAWTGKNSKERVIEVTRLLKDSLSISMSVQALDPAVLKNIKRDNIKLDHYKAITQELNAQGRPQHAELIVPLPGETLQSHIKSLVDLLETNVGSINVHTLQMLHGTPYKDSQDYISRWGFAKAKYRVVPLDFGVYDGTPVFDTEAVAVETKDFTFSDYIQSRKLTLLIDVFYNGSVFRVLRHYLRSRGVPVSSWILKLYAQMDHFPSGIKKIIDSFEQETKDELWDSERALWDHYSKLDHYQKLVHGDAGGNVLYRHKVWLFSEQSEALVNMLFAFTETLVPKTGDGAAVKELSELKRFILSILQDSFKFDDARPSFEESFSHDILAWLADKDAPPLSQRKTAQPMRLLFLFEPDQLALRNDAKKRYGASLAGMVKLVQRISGHHRLMRKIFYCSAYSQSSGETLANVKVDA